MTSFNRKAHWENVYQTKELTQVSWYEPTPHTPLDFIKKHFLDKNTAIIDIGGGDSFLADHLLKDGYTNITVLDISGAALKRAQERLGENAHLIRWIEADITQWEPQETYDFWYDRAALHFLTNLQNQKTYFSTASKAVTIGGKMVIGAFSTQGPLKCSGIEIQQYDEKLLTALAEPTFKKVHCFTQFHTTPSGSQQHFIFCHFNRV